ncbi:hypothetical protein [Hugenholtzia roseola]|uniref:hypothetical protein n=1 Tax=Hugenholtzia roseola TaxID=1002 RepID=UPI00047EDE17|nr:hypothetical protein [Hugenholtzia roseola]
MKRVVVFSSLILMGSKDKTAKEKRLPLFNSLFYCKKNTTIKLLFLLFTLFFCTACPYESDVPIDLPKVPTEQRFLGRWRLKSGSKNFFTIDRQDRFRYKIEENAYNATTGVYEKRFYAGHLTYLKGVPFLQVRVLEGTEMTAVAPTEVYYLYKVQTLTSQEVELVLLSEKNPKFNNSIELKNYILRNLLNPNLYEKTEKYIKE